MRNKKWKIYLGLLIVLIISVTLIIRTKQNKTSGEVTREISPTYGNIQTFISTTGTVQPQNRLEIKPPISGRVEEILVKEGEKVRIGQTLAWMSSTERAALLDAARSQGEEVLKHWQEVYKPTPLIAPIDGEVIVRAVEPGQTVTSAEAVIVLSDRLIVKARVDETDIGKVKLGQPAIISLDAYPQVRVRARVDHISYESKIINNVTIYEVDILPQRVPDIFRSGMSANVHIIEKSKENILLIPLEAVKQGAPPPISSPLEGEDLRKGRSPEATRLGEIKEGDKLLEGSFVLLSQGPGKKPVKRKVELGISDYKNVEIISGLQINDKIIMKTQKYLPSEGKRAGGSPFIPPGRKGRSGKR